MSVRVSAWVFDQSEATGNDRLILLALADEADDDGTNAYPSIERLARKARINRATTIRAIQRLEAAGELVVRRPETHGRGHHNTYVIVMGRTCPETSQTATLSDNEKRNEKERKGPETSHLARPNPKTLRPVDPKPENLLSADADEFDEFWSIYPRRDERKRAAAAFAKARKRADLATIIAGAARYRDDPNRAAQFTKQAPTWLNGDCWNDPPLPPRVGARPARTDDAIKSAFSRIHDRYNGDNPVETESKAIGP